ncbi:hypothetical protein ABE450_000548 [Clostridium perfringens]|uniref:hypothetical protein n=1 Tax=Clostridium perfringens TaxID=1502 RepID=UPI0013E2D218|nr:hypothetical protein [Clostridium perfringens]EJT6154775.1 hypothetical protein [Clostridium perfringens]MDK0577623.1 hypothetical protein [Clostridium perfringens]MDK0580566.1 hypothetical protein [Clostridium perfringens]MDK0667759.1 hypothetical protein [Clostridium perfringens]MDM0627277.1 hypothetical protein [Clostridium perfringens]
MVQYIEGLPIMVVNNLQERIRKSKVLDVLRGASVQELAKDSTNNIDFESMIENDNEYDENDYELHQTNKI